MGQFLYFLTDCRTAKDAGLGYALEDKCALADMQGPTGKGGVILSRDATAIRFDAEWKESGSQEWLERGDGRVWIGMNTADPPMALTLERAEMLPGEPLPMAAGGMWQVPRLRMYVAEHGLVTALPQRMRRSKGQWCDGGVLEEWQAADQLGEELLELVVRFYEESESPLAKLSVAEAAGYVSRILRINYRVTDDELGLLGVLPTDSRLIDALRYAIDYDTAEADLLGKLGALAE